MYRFDSYLDFYAFLQEHPFLVASGSGSVVEFRDAVLAISQGCGCSRKKREQHAITKYLSIGSNLDDAFKENLKILLEVQQVFFHHQDSLFLEV